MSSCLYTPSRRLHSVFHTEYSGQNVSIKHNSNKYKTYNVTEGLHVSTVSHLQALMIQIHTKNVLCIVGSPTLTISVANTEDVIEQMKINSDDTVMNIRAELLCQKEVLHN